jgi:septum formation inhibitor-activating ATPase MinD
MLIDKKLLLFGGKGGVGKTSMAAATGIYAASHGKKDPVIIKALSGILIFADEEYFDMLNEV